MNYIRGKATTASPDSKKGRGSRKGPLSEQAREGALDRAPERKSKEALDMIARDPGSVCRFRALTSRKGKGEEPASCTTTLNELKVKASKIEYKPAYSFARPESK